MPNQFDPNIPSLIGGEVSADHRQDLRWFTSDNKADRWHSFDL